MKVRDLIMKLHLLDGNAEIIVATYLGKMCHVEQLTSICKNGKTVQFNTQSFDEKYKNATLKDDKNA